MAKCLFGHKWNECICSRCGKRNLDPLVKHDYVINIGESRAEKLGCRFYCSRCGDLRFKKHNFVPAKDRCVQICSYCGREEAVPHKFESIEGSCKIKCRVCGETAQGKHSLVREGCREICEYCGFVNSEHKWIKTKFGNGYHDGCVCEICGTKNRRGVHYWETVTDGKYSDIRRCKNCGLEDRSQAILLKDAEEKRAEDIKRRELYSDMDEGIR